MYKSKKIYLSLLIFVLLLLSQISYSYAASFSFSASKTTAKPNSTIELTIKANGEGRLDISAKNATISETSVWVDGQYTLSVTVGEKGSSIISVEAVDVTSYEEEAITGKKSITIEIEEVKVEEEKEEVVQPETDNNEDNENKKPESNKEESNKKPENNKVESDKKPEPSKPQKDEESEKEPVYQETIESDDNTLKSLSISSGQLEPSFDKHTYSYNVELDSNVQSITIDASSNDHKASLKGTGTYELKTGKQDIKIVCTSESGLQRTYTLHINVKKEQVFIDFNNQSLEISKISKNTKLPSGFKKTNIEINGHKVESYVNEQFNFNLLYLKDQKGHSDFYIYDNQIVSVFKQLKVLGQTYIVCEIPSDLKNIKDMTLKDIDIEGVKLQGWMFNDSSNQDFAHVYLMNENGEKQMYCYDFKEGTIQRIHDFNIELFKESPSMSIDTILLSIIAFIFILTTIGFAYLYFNNLKVSKRRLIQSTSNRNENNTLS